jgi:hypothetical protein
MKPGLPMPTRVHTTNPGAPMYDMRLIPHLGMCVDMRESICFEPWDQVHRVFFLHQAWEVLRVAQLRELRR